MYFFSQTKNRFTLDKFLKLLFETAIKVSLNGKFANGGGTTIININVAAEETEKKSV